MRKDNKIGLLTFHSAQNYGAVLQCYATIRYLTSNGFSIETIDYQNKALIERYQKPKLTFFLNPKNIYRIFKYNIAFVPNKSFSIFAKQYLNLSKTSYRERNFNSIYEEYKTIIVGSDQVWNLSCNGNDFNYFLPESSKINKIGLSISCGGKSDQLGENILYEINSFNALSIRENQDAECLKSKLENKIIENTLDPVFLLNKETWTKFSDDSIIPNYNYVLVYMVFEDKELIKFVKRNFSKQKIIYVNQGSRNVKGFKNIRNVTPQQFVSLINNATIVFTNSFHGLAFSLILKKNFGAKLLSTNISINNRVKELLKKFNCLDHLIDNKNYSFNYSSYDNEKEISKLKNYLLRSLKL